jgi:hypothetical protein
MYVCAQVQPLTPEQVVEWHRLNDERWTAYHRLRVPVVGSADGKMTIPVHVLTAGRVEGREDGSLHFHFIAVELLTMPISAPCAMEKKAYHFPCQLVTMALPVAVSRADGGYALSFSCTDGFGVHPYIEALPAADAAFALQSKNPDAATFSLSKNQWNELLETRDIPGDFNDVEFHPRLDMCQLGAFLQRIPGSPGDGDDDDGEYDVDLVGGDGDGDVGGDDEKKFRLDLPSLAWEDHFNPKSPLDNPTKEDTLQQISPLQHILEHQLSFDLFLIVLGYTNIGFMPTYPEVISSYLVSPMLLQRKFRQQRPSTSSTSSSASSSASSTPESEKKKRILDVITKTLVFPPLPPL